MFGEGDGSTDFAKAVLKQSLLVAVLDLSIFPCEHALPCHIQFCSERGGKGPEKSLEDPDSRLGSSHYTRQLVSSPHMGF